MSRQLGVLWLLTLFTYANHVHWQGTYNKALQQAQKEHKILLVLVVKNKDPLSNKIIQNIFMDHAYVDTINQKMVAIIVTYESSLSYPVEMYYTTVFPALFFVDTQTETFMREPLYGESITKESLEYIFK